jgi:hypothetical protein
MDQFHLAGAHDRILPFPERLISIYEPFRQMLNENAAAMLERPIVRKVVEAPAAGKDPRVCIGRVV